MIAEVRKLHHFEIEIFPQCSTLSGANMRRSEKIFEEIYRNLYESNKDKLISDSQKNHSESWINRLRIID